MKNVALLISYQTNYNGCCVITVSDDPTLNDLYFEDVQDIDQEFGDKMEQLQNAVPEKFFDDCDEDCAFEGSIKEVRAFIAEKVTELFGEDQQHEVEIDRTST